MPEMHPYLPVLMMAGLGVFFAASALGASWLLQVRARDNPIKNTPYECGLPIESQAHERFSVKFYAVAMLFILFDVEIVFMYPWAVSFGKSGQTPDPASLSALVPPTPEASQLLVSAAAFVVILFIGWVYVIKKGVLQWHGRA